MEFKKQTDADGDPVECDCCGYPGRVALFPDTLCESGARDWTLCEVCATTHLSIAEKYPRQCPDVHLYKSIAILGNMLLEAIRERNVTE